MCSFAAGHRFGGLSAIYLAKHERSETKAAINRRVGADANDFERSFQTLSLKCICVKLRTLVNNKQKKENET